jgi:hypothetical protein
VSILKIAKARLRTVAGSASGGGIGSSSKARCRRRNIPILNILTHSAQAGKIHSDPPAVQACLTRRRLETSLFLNLVVKIAPRPSVAARRSILWETPEWRGGDSITTKDTNYTKGEGRSFLFELRIRPNPNFAFRAFSVFRGSFPMALVREDSSPRLLRNPRLLPSAIEPLISDISELPRAWPLPAKAGVDPGLLGALIAPNNASAGDITIIRPMGC